jgi:hypothetical protein
MRYILYDTLRFFQQVKFTFMFGITNLGAYIKQVYNVKQSM